MLLFTQFSSVKIDQSLFKTNYSILQVQRYLRFIAEV